VHYLAFIKAVWHSIITSQLLTCISSHHSSVFVAYTALIDTTSHVMVCRNKRLLAV